MERRLARWRVGHPGPPFDAATVLRTSASPRGFQVT
jgi:hypothetical protein